jgi:ZIP family zinc transporter
MTAIYFSIASFVSTTIGGLLALRLRSRLRYVMGFTSGVLVALVAFDLLPEIFHLVHEQAIDPVIPMLALMLGYLAFYAVEKMSLIHHSHESETGETLTTHPQVGLLSALALSGHSFLDGVGIGLGFQVSTTAGIIVAIAVIAHDMSDGLNTVTLMLVNQNTRRRALAMLALDAIAPVLGTLSTFLFTIHGIALPIYLGFFAGFLLYIGASDILPAAHSKQSTAGTVLLTFVGALFAFVVTRFV